MEEKPLLKAPASTDEPRTVDEGPNSPHRSRDAGREGQARTTQVTTSEAPTAEPASPLTATDPTAAAPLEHTSEDRAVASTPNGEGSDATGERSAPGEAEPILQVPVGAAAEDVVAAADADGIAAETVVGDAAESDAAVPSGAAVSGAVVSPEVPADVRMPLTELLRRLRCRTPRRSRQLFRSGRPAPVVARC